MFEWPQFAAHLCGVDSTPTEKLRSLLTYLGACTTPRSQDVLTVLFDSTALTEALAPIVPHLHHVGVLAPSHLNVPTVRDLMRDSPFGDQIRQFRSVVLAKDLSALLDRQVEVTVVQGTAPARSRSYPAVEVFVADLPPATLDPLVERETGCHVALELVPDSSFEHIRDVLHAHGRHEIPLMRHGALTNPEVGLSMLYVDVPGPEHTRRLELIAKSGDWSSVIGDR